LKLRSRLAGSLEDHISAEQSLALSSNRGNETTDSHARVELDVDGPVGGVAARSVGDPRGSLGRGGGLEVLCAEHLCGISVGIPGRGGQVDTRGVHSRRSRAPPSSDPGSRPSPSRRPGTGLAQRERATVPRAERSQDGTRQMKGPRRSPGTSWACSMPCR
jgi:hypothetical protein